MADDRMRNSELDNAGTMGNQKQQSPGRNRSDDQMTGQRGGMQHDKDEGLGKGNQGNTGRDELNFDKGGREGTEGHSGRRNL